MMMMSSNSSIASRPPDSVSQPTSASPASAAQPTHVSALHPASASSSFDPQSTHEHACIFCPQKHGNPHDLRDHYLNPHTHGPTLARRDRARLAATPHTSLVVCPTCTDLHVSSGQQGYSLHRHHRHSSTPNSPPSPNSAITKDLLNLATDLTFWHDALSWLHSNPNLAVPPPHRKSLCDKMPKRIKESPPTSCSATCRSMPQRHSQSNPSLRVLFCALPSPLHCL